MRDQPIEYPRRGEHAGQAGTGMRAGADEKQAIDIFAAIMRPEPRTLTQHRFETERRPLHGKQALAKVERRHHA